MSFTLWVGGTFLFPANKQCGKQAMDIIHKHPYQLCEMASVGFKTADKIAVGVGFDLCSPERVDKRLLYMLTEAELRGHLCLENHEFITMCTRCHAGKAAHIHGYYQNKGAGDSYWRS